MASMNQQEKAQINSLLKQAIPGTWKWSLGVRHNSTIVLNIYSAPVDLVAEYASGLGGELQAEIIKKKCVDVNPYTWDKHFAGELLETFTKIFAALNLDNHDNSDPQSDYFDVGHYVDANIGKWDKPFEVK